MHGQGDRVIDPRNAADIERGLVCSAAVERRMYPRSGHGMSVDVDRDEINAQVLQWFERFVPVPATTSGPAGGAAAETTQAADKPKRPRRAPAKPRQQS
jgi:hypothetical protein